MAHLALEEVSGAVIRPFSHPLTAARLPDQRESYIETRSNRSDRACDQIPPTLQSKHNPSIHTQSLQYKYEDQQFVGVGPKIVVAYVLGPVNRIATHSLTIHSLHSADGVMVTGVGLMTEWP